MAKSPTRKTEARPAASAPTVAAMPDMRLEMLPPELRLAVEGARFRCKDETIMARIEAYEHMPGRVVVERGGKDLQHGMHIEQALDYLSELPAAGV